MGKRIVSSRPTRDHHKQRNTWYVVDLPKAQAAMDAARLDPRNAAFADHDGKLFEACRRACVVMRLEGAYTEYSARLFASNGGFAKYRQARQLGQAISRKYMDERVFVVAEAAVMNHWVGQRRIRWDTAAARAELYAERGVGVLPALCTSFIPPGDSEEEYQASLPGVKTVRPEPYLCLNRGVSGRPRRFNPPKRVLYRIVDLDEFRRRRGNLVFDSADRGLEPLEIPDEGRLFKHALVGSFSAAGWRSALQRFRNRLAGEMDLALPFGRFTAIPDSVWQVLVTLPNLPRNLSREYLLVAARLAAKRDTKLRKIEAEAEKRLGHFAWLPSWEPGMEDIKQLPLPGTQLLRDVLEFPPREHGSRLKRLVAGKLPRIVPPKRRGRRMRQQELPDIPRFAIQASGQLCLCACDRPNPAARATEQSSAIRPAYDVGAQLEIRFPRPSSEWSQPPLFPGVEPAARKRQFFPRRKRAPIGQARLPFMN